MHTIIVLGGGAAGFFGAIIAASASPSCKVILLEKSASLLTKVRISGGGRCNVTHACFDPNRLILNYPRGGQELLGPFHRFQPKDTIAWYEGRGVELKAEGDGRMFPITDSSQTIIDCLSNAALQHGVDIRLKQKIASVGKDDGAFQLKMENGDVLSADCLLLATGSSPQGHELARVFGHKIVPSVPSLFTFNVPSSPLLELSGIAVPHVALSLEGGTHVQQGPLLLTHWGFSGPAALKLSAWEARFLHNHDYCVGLVINWLGDVTQDQCLQKLLMFKKEGPSLVLARDNPLALPKNLWKQLIEITTLDGNRRWGDIANKDLAMLSSKLVSDRYAIEGKTTYKEEFVTCGGISLKEVNFKTMESKLCPGLYFAGEILDIDGITGGFNFQNAWTTAWIAGKAMTSQSI